VQHTKYIDKAIKSMKENQNNCVKISILKYIFKKYRLDLNKRQLHDLRSNKKNIPSISINAQISFS
jgi:hypothetical protein